MSEYRNMYDFFFSLTFFFFFSPIAQNFELTTESSNSNDYETTEDILDFDESDSDCESYQQYDCGSGICIPITKVCDGEKGTSHSSEV